MKQELLIYLALVWLFSGCNTPPPKKQSTSTFLLKETIVSGSDNGMTDLAGFKRSFAETLCQRWELASTDDAADELVWDTKTGDRLFPCIALFKDSTVIENGRGNVLAGKWRIQEIAGTRLLQLTFPGKIVHSYILQKLTNHQIQLTVATSKGFQRPLLLTSDGKVHQNNNNDPFYYPNIRWQLRPTAPESDSAIHQRAKDCIKFYALYFRDFIKRKQEKISFSGLPEIFTWYNQAIGLPDRDKLSASWINCFYNKAQAEKAYNLLRSLIVNYEFDWPTGTPSWEYKTHSVLEQMYHKF